MLQSSRQEADGVTSRKLMKLQRQKEIVEQWLQTPGIPTDAHAKLLEMLGEVSAEIMTRFATANNDHNDAHRLAT